jgi:hypothetical protein
MARRYRMADVAFDGPTDVEQPPGAFLLIRQDACPRPLLDRAYRNFFSDVELCRILGRLGTIRMEPDVRCFHVRGGAGLVTHDPIEHARLHHDLVWGLRRYFRSVGVVGRAWIGLWVIVFWALRLAQAVGIGHGHLRASWAAATASLAGRPPAYATEGAT